MSNTKIQPRNRTGATAGSTSSVSTGATAGSPSSAGFRVDVAHQRATASGTILSARRLTKSYKKGKHVIPVLRGVDFAAQEGDFTAIVGQSGSGKSTLLHLLATLDKPDAGSINFQNHRIDNMPAGARDLIRNKYFGMVFQFYHLLPELSALQNILAPAMIAESTLGYLMRRGTYRRRAYELLDVVGIAARAKHKPRELSGGEMQRAAIARALVARPQILLADEPTGNLDATTGGEIMDVLRTLNEQEQLTVVMVTHDNAIARQADRIVRLDGGRIQALGEAA